MSNNTNLNEVCQIIKSECDVIISADDETVVYECIDGILELLPLLLKASDMSMNTDGGSGSGNWGHSGRPGKRGGSAGGTGGVTHRTGTKESGFSSAAKEKAKAKKQSGSGGSGSSDTPKKSEEKDKYATVAGSQSKESNSQKVVRPEETVHKERELVKGKSNRFAVENQEEAFSFTGGEQKNIKLIDGSPATEDEILTALQHQYGVPKSRAKKMVEEGELSNNQVQRAMNAESAREMIPAGRMRTERTNELNKKFGVSEEVQTKKVSDRETNARKEREREAELDRVQGPIRKEKKKLIEQQGNKAKSVSDSKLANKEYETKTASGTEKTSLQKALNAKNVEQTKQVLDKMPEGTKFVCTGQNDRAHTIEKISKPNDPETKWRKISWIQNASKTSISERWENIDTAYAEQLIRFSGNNGVHIVE